MSEATARSDPQQTASPVPPVFSTVRRRCWRSRYALSRRRCSRFPSDGRIVIARLFAIAVTIFARIVTGCAANGGAVCRKRAQRIYFANHTSHGDFVLIWTVLPAALRRSHPPGCGCRLLAPRPAAPLHRRTRCSTPC